MGAARASAAAVRARGTLCGALALLVIALAQAPRGWLLVPLEQGRVGGAHAVDCTAHWLGFLLGERAVRVSRTPAGRTRVAVVGTVRTPDALRLVSALRHAPATADAAAARVAREALRRFPGRLDAFEAATRFRQWPSELVTASRAKHLPRRIYRNPGKAWSMSVAETLRADGSVRETEIVQRRSGTRDSVDFFVYDARGELADAADFGAPGLPAMLPAPAVCVRCHYDGRHGGPRRLPAFLGAMR